MMAAEKMPTLNSSCMWRRCRNWIFRHEKRNLPLRAQRQTVAFRGSRMNVHEAHALQSGYFRNATRYNIGRPYAIEVFEA